MGRYRIADEEPESMRIAFRHPLDQAGWTIVYHLIVLDQRISDGTLRLYLLLHRYAQQHTETWVSVERLAEDLGVNPKTIKRRLKELRDLGLIDRQREGFGTTFTTYLLDPRERYYACSIGDKNVPYEHAIGDKNVPSYGTNLSPHEEITIEEIKEEQEEEKSREQKSKTDEIARTLKENGVFTSTASEIAWRMAEAGLGPEDALAILLGTIQSIQTGMPRGEEEVMSLAVDRLRRGIWDAGEQMRDTLRRARYAGSVKAQTTPQPVPVQEKPKTREEKLWQAALGELQLELTRATYETLLRHSRLVAVEDGTFVVGVASTYAREWLESRLRPVVVRVLTRLIGRTTDVRFVVAS